MKTIIHTLTINEPPWLVWDTLLKVHEYDNWNPVYKYISGEPKIGEYVKVEVQMDLEYIMTFGDDELKAIFGEGGVLPNKQKLKYRVKQLIENEKLEWESKLFGGMLVTANHTFELKEVNTGQTTFSSSTQVGGFLINLMPKKVYLAFYTAFNMAFNLALKDYIETGVGIYEGG